jgi:MFS family permease
MLASFAIMIPLTFVKSYAHVELGLEQAVSTTLFTIIGFVGIIGALTIPILSDRIGRRLALMACNAITAAGLLGSAVLARPRNYFDVALCNAVIGIGYGAMWPLYAALVKDIYCWEVMGSITGLWTLLCGIGLLTSPTIGGFVADSYSSYRPAYMVGFVTALASIVLIAVLGFRRKKSEREKVRVS